MKRAHPQIPSRLGLLAGAFCTSLAAFAQVASIEAISRSSKPEAAGESRFIELGDDPRWAIFASDANVYTPGDNNGSKVDIYLRDILARQNILISRGLSGGGANGHSIFPFLSMDGRWVVFESDASNLVEGDTNNGSDVFLFERDTGRVSLISQTANSGRQGEAGLLAVTPDARFVVFHSSADDLVENDANGAHDLLLWNRETKALELLTMHWASERSATNGRTGPPLEATISEDGARVAFVAFPSDMAPEGTYGTTEETWAASRTGPQLFLWDSITKTNRLITPLSVTAEPARYSQSGGLVMSVNGERLVFFNEIRPTNQGSPTRNSWWAYSIPQQKLEEVPLLSTNAPAILTEPALNADGSLLACSLDGQVVLHDFATGSNRVVSTTAQSVPGQSRSYAPALAADGGALVFLSGASELVPAAEFYQSEQLLRFDRSTGMLDLAVRARGGSGGADADLFFPTLRADGRAAGFVTAANNISALDTGGRPQAFAIDLTGTNDPVLISESAEELRSTTALGASRIDSGAMSWDGRLIAFVSAAQLTEEDTNTTYDLYLKDLHAGETRLLSFPIQGTMRSEFMGFNGMSADGALILYTARQYFAGSNITAIVASRASDRSVSAVSLLPKGSLATNASTASLSADGKTMAFVAEGRAYVRTLPDGISKGVGNSLFNVNSPNVVLSPRGNFLLINSGTSIREIYSLQTGRLRAVTGGLLTDAPFSADDRQMLTMHFSAGVPSQLRLFVTDTTTFLSNLVAESVSDPATLSADGSTAFYAKRTGANTDVYAHNLATGTAQPLFLEGKSIWPRRAMAASADGRYLAVALTNAVAPGRSVLFHQLHVFDVWRTNSFLLSRSLASAPANGPSSSPSLSADGRTVAFDSTGSDLVSNDRNDFSDVFVARLASVDANANGIEDGWEQKHLRAGATAAEDLDRDGATNLQEFLAGTDPASAASVLAITRAHFAAEPRSVQIFWNGVLGRSYRVQYRASMPEGEWSDLGAPRVAIGNEIMQQVENAEAPGGFFRIIATP